MESNMGVIYLEKREKPVAELINEKEGFVIRSPFIEDAEQLNKSGFSPNPVLVMEAEEKIFGCGYYDSSLNRTRVTVLPGEQSMGYDRALYAALETELNFKKGSAPKQLTEYNDKTIRLVTVWDEVFYSVACHFCAEYGMHEFGWEEEGLQIGGFGGFIFYKSQIKFIDEWKC